MSIKSTPSERLIEEQIKELLHLYSKEGIKPINLTEKGIELYKNGYKISVEFKARKVKS